MRTVLVPAVVELVGRGNWWLPRWLERILPEVAEPQLRSTEVQADPADAVL